MNLCRCENGHFFDKEKYAVCPHCSNNASDESLTTIFTEEPAKQESSGGGNTFSGNVTGDLSQMGAFPVADMEADQFTVQLDQPEEEDSVTVPLEQFTNVGNYAMGAEDDDHTVGFFDSDLFGAPSTPPPASPHPVSPHPVSKVQPIGMMPPVNKVSTPCVGWVIALNGEHIGTDFRLKVGKNFLGRSPQMDIALTEDKSVSREKHTIIVYEPKAHLYMLQPGESSSLVYKNDEVVLSPVNLAPYDKITVGEVDLLFMPLCNEKFNWSDWLEQTKKRGSE